MKVEAKCTNQFLMKSRDRDMPHPLQFTKFTAVIDVPTFKSELLPYVSTYLYNQKAIEDAEHTSEAPLLKSYDAPRELVKKWRTKVRKGTRSNLKVQDTCRISDDDVIEQAIVLEVDFALENMLTDEFKDVLLKQAGIEKPEDNDKEYLAATILHIVGWSPV